MEEKIATNKHLSTFGDRRDYGVIGGSQGYEVYTQTINSDKWGGRNVNFQVNNLSLDRLIIGDKCFVAFNCYATTFDEEITDADIELRPGVGNLIVDGINVKIAGTTVHSDSNAALTRHFYEHLNYPNSARLADEYLHRFIIDDLRAFPPSAALNSGYLNRAILNKRHFTIIRPLTDVTFFGHRDTSIPASLPITIDLRLNTDPRRCFNCDAGVFQSPLLYIMEAELHIYSVALEESYSEVIKEALVTDTLIASSDTWTSMSLGSQITGGNTTYKSPSSIVIETTPDVFGISIMPTSSYLSASPWTGKHPYTSSWNEMKEIYIQQFGKHLRSYLNLGGNAYVGKKHMIYEEVKQIAGGDVQAGLGNPPINAEVFCNGDLSFVPVVFRDISESSVLKPKPTSLTFYFNMDNTSVDAVVQVFYKVRHHWQLSLNTGKTAIIQ